MKPKVLIIRFELDADYYETVKKHYSDKDIRQILEDGGFGELRIVIDNKEGNDNEWTT